METSSLILVVLITTAINLAVFIPASVALRRLISTRAIARSAARDSKQAAAALADIGAAEQTPAFEAVPKYRDDDAERARMDLRHAKIVAPFRKRLNGARLLDLAAHDGRWSYAFAAAGAGEVIGVEGRADMIAQFSNFPDDEARSRVTLLHGDVFDYLESAVTSGERFDVVAVLGFLYHTLDHYRLFLLIGELSPDLIIVDGEFLDKKNPEIKVQKERTGNHLNATGYFRGEQMPVTLVGIPSVAAMERFAEMCGYVVTWLDWREVPEAHRINVGDYYRPEVKRRMTCYLTKSGGR